jgi:hypothetical protein
MAAVRRMTTTKRKAERTRRDRIFGHRPIGSPAPVFLMAGRVNRGRIKSDQHDVDEDTGENAPVAHLVPAIATFQLRNRRTHEHRDVAA